MVFVLQNPKVKQQRFEKLKNEFQNVTIVTVMLQLQCYSKNREQGVLDFWDNV